MFRLEHSLLINRPPQDVFDFITDPSRMSEWGLTYSAEWTTDSPHGVGSERRSTAKFFGLVVETVAEITVWEPPTRYDFRTKGPYFAEMTHRLESGDAGTNLMVSAVIDASGILRITDPLLKRQFDKQMASDIAAIKSILEREGV